MIEIAARVEGPVALGITRNGDHVTLKVKKNPRYDKLRLENPYTTYRDKEYDVEFRCCNSVQLKMEGGLIIVYLIGDYGKESNSYTYVVENERVADEIIRRVSAATENLNDFLIERGIK